jgi:glycosyltransferase involved in cell wall biosynthesis
MSQSGRPRVLLINAFEKIPGEAFRDQRYTFLYQILRRHAEVKWLSSDFHHWSHQRRSPQTLPPEDRAHIELIRTLPYTRNVSVRRFISYLVLSLATLGHLRRLPWRPDVIVCMGPVEQMFLAALYGRLHGIPVIIDVIDTWPDLYLQAFPRSMRWLGRVLLAPYFLMSRLTFAWASQVTAVSETYLAWAMTRGRRKDTERFHCFHLGCRNPDFDVSAVPDRPPVLRCLFAGQFSHSYDVELIVAAAARLARAGRADIEFVLCGDGYKREALQQLTARLPNVRLLGWVTPEQLNALAVECQIGLCCYGPAATQSLPTKIFDYLSMGLFVVSSLPEEAARLLEAYHAGASYRAGDLDSFLKCLDKAAAGASLGRAARGQIRTAFEKHFESSVIFERMVREFILPIAQRPRPANALPPGARELEASGKRNP